jgi:hypothetical protein
MNEEGQKAVHEALRFFLPEGEIPISWTLTIEVAGEDGGRYLAHRAGGGFDGTEAPMVWSALGLLSAGLRVAQRQLDDVTQDVEDEEPDVD